MKLLPVKTANKYVVIRPFTASDINILSKTGADSDIWTHYIDEIDGTIDSVRKYLYRVYDLQQRGERLIHTIMTPEGEFVGQSCYMAVNPRHRRVEIGATWYAPQFQGTKINSAVKLALLENAFQSGAMRVEFKCDENNKRSRSAIKKIGATFEGIFRKHIVRANGEIRNTAYYSIIDDDWADVKSKLSGIVES